MREKKHFYQLKLTNKASTLNDEYQKTEKSSKTHNEYHDDNEKEAVYRKETIGASIMRIQKIKRKSEVCMKCLVQKSV